MNFAEESNRRRFSHNEGDDNALPTAQRAYCEIKLLTVRNEEKPEETREPRGAMC